MLYYFFEGVGGILQKVIANDEIVDRQKHPIDIEDRGYQFGDGVYEVIRVYHGELFALDAHIDRLYKSSTEIDITVPFSKATLKTNLLQLVKDNSLELGIVYMQLTRGVASRAHVFPSEQTLPIFTAYTKDAPIPSDSMKNGVKAITMPDIRWLRCDIKSLNLLPNILAKEEAKKQNCYEAIFHREQIVTEGSSSNIFIVKNNVLTTHPATNYILNGITRQIVFQLCEENNLPYEERPFELEELKKADEVFLTSTVSEVMPIIEMDGHPIGNGLPGTLTQQLQNLYQKYIQHHARVAQ